MHVVQLAPPGSGCSTFFGFEDPDGNSWAVQEIKARADKPLIPKNHTGLGEWAGQ